MSFLTIEVEKPRAQSVRVAAGLPPSAAIWSRAGPRIWIGTGALGLFTLG